MNSKLEIAQSFQEAIEKFDYELFQQAINESPDSSYVPENILYNLINLVMPRHGDSIVTSKCKEEDILPSLESLLSSDKISSTHYEFSCFSSRPTFNALFSKSPRTLKLLLKYAYRKKNRRE